MIHGARALCKLLIEAPESWGGLRLVRLRLRLESLRRHLKYTVRPIPNIFTKKTFPANAHLYNQRSIGDREGTWVQLGDLSDGAPAQNPMSMISQGISETVSQVIGNVCQQLAAASTANNEAVMAMGRQQQEHNMQVMQMVLQNSRPAPPLFPPPLPHMPPAATDYLPDLSQQIEAVYALSQTRTR